MLASLASLASLARLPSTAITLSKVFLYLVWSFLIARLASLPAR